jgi:hypothetical protein
MADKTYLAVYEDKECTKPVNKMDFGRLVLGEKYTFTWYMKNHSEQWIIQNIEMDQSLNTDEIKITHPEILLPNEVAQVDLTFKPSINRRDPLFSKGLFTSELWIG